MTHDALNPNKFGCMSVRVRVLSAALAFFLCSFAGISVSAQTTEFVYQGQLQNASAPATGSYDFVFSLYDAPASGLPLGTLTKSNVAVANGIFSVNLDFGPSFPGAGRFLEIVIRQSGGGPFTVLSPRQPVSSAPYAIKSLSADAATNSALLGGVGANQYLQINGNGSGLTNLNAGNITTGTLSNARLGQVSTANIADLAVTDAKIAAMTASKLSGVVAIANGGTGLTTPGSTGNYLRSNGMGWATTTIQAGDLPDLGGAYIKNGSTVQTASLNISGNATAGGTLSGNIVNSAAQQYNVNGVRFLYGPLVNTFLGKEAGNLSTSGNENSFVGWLAGNGTTSGTGNSFFGVAAGLGNTTGSVNTLVGRNAGVTSSNLINATALGAFARVSQSDSLVLGNNANVGIGISNPVTKLHVVGNIAKATPATVRSFLVSTNDPYTGPGNPASPFALDIRLVGAANLADRAAFLQTTDIDTMDGGNILLQPQGGRVGIGTTNPSDTLSVNGTASKTGGGSWATFSDERLKNINGRFTPGLAAVMRLQPVRYRYKAGNALDIKADGEYVGFSAQAVEKVIPEAVTKNEQGYRMVNNDPIMWAMLNAVKEQEVLIEKQNALNKKQGSEIEALKALVCLSHRTAAPCRAKK